MASLLELLRCKVDPAKVKKVSGAKGGEWHSPCPLCGGNDRFCVFPEQEGGELCQKHGLRGTWACARGCGKGGDLISWFMEIEGLPFKDACAELNIPLESHASVRRGYRPLRKTAPAALNVFNPVLYAEPSEKWQQAATRLALEAYRRIYGYPAIMKYLASRGLPQAAVDAYGLGYLEGDGKHPESIFRQRSAYDLPEKNGKDGKPVRAFRMPRGITIPVWTGDGMRALRIRIRRRDADRDRANPKDPKYLLVPQPGQPYSAPLMLYPEDTAPELATWVVTEAELDAMAIHHACAGKIGAISILTAKGKPDKIAHEALSRCARILVALDADEDKPDGSNPGADAWLWWKQTYPQAKLWPVPIGKDPGEAFSLGVNLADWIFAAAPLRKSFPMSQSACAPDDPPAQTCFGLDSPVIEAHESGNMGKSCLNADNGKGGGEVEVFQMPASAASFAEISLPEGVSHYDLLRSMAKHPLGDPQCLLPCPKTEPPFWWCYHRDCSRFRCKGHPLCLLGVLRSKLFQEALNAKKNLFCQSV